MRISDWSSDVCSSDLQARILRSWFRIAAILRHFPCHPSETKSEFTRFRLRKKARKIGEPLRRGSFRNAAPRSQCSAALRQDRGRKTPRARGTRSEEHTSELQSLMRISYAVFCLKKKKNN